MAIVPVSPGVGTLQAACVSANDGDTIVMADGTYTTVDGRFFDLRTGIVGAPFTDLTIVSENTQGIRVGDATGVKFQDMI